MRSFNIRALAVAALFVVLPLVSGHAAFRDDRRARREQHLRQGCGARSGLSGPPRGDPAREGPLGARDQCGINGNTTGQMLARMDRAVPRGTSVVILQPGGNDRRKGEHDASQNLAEIQSRLSARGVRVVMMENGMLRGLPKQADRQHLTPDGYHMLAEAIAGQVEGSLGR